MKVDEYLQSIGLENVIDEEFFNADDKSWYKVSELMEAYHQAKLDLLTISVVSESCSINGKGMCDYDNRLGLCPRCDTDAYSR